MQKESPSIKSHPYHSRPRVKPENIKRKSRREKVRFYRSLSISQYLESVNALENIIRSLKPYLNDSGKIIIADVVDPKTSALRDLIAIKFQCIKTGRLIAFVRFFFYLLFSSYRRLSRNVQLLHISEENMKHIAS